MVAPLVAQKDIPEAFKEKAERIVKMAPKTYLVLDSELKKEKRDTTLLRYFANLCNEAGYLDGESYALDQIGTKYRNTSQFEKAAALHQKALEIAEKANNTELKVLSLNMLGVVYRRTDAIKTALDYNQQALELAEQVENPSHHILRSINVSLNSIGNLYQTLEQYDLAILQFKRALRLEEELGNKLGLAINHQNIGDCLEYKGDLEGALLLVEGADAVADLLQSLAESERIVFGMNTVEHQPEMTLKMGVFVFESIFNFENAIKR